MQNFNRDQFYPKKNNINSDTLIKDNELKITKYFLGNNFILKDISSPKRYFRNSILFLYKYIKNLPKHDDILHITDNNQLYEKLDSNLNRILVSNLDETYGYLVNKIFLTEDSTNFNDQYNLKNGSYISKFSNIDDSTKIGVNCTIGMGVKIGKDCIIKDNVVIKSSIIGDNVIIGQNSVIGSTGFGFNLKKLGSINILPHIGIVEICDNVRIGSCCTIDRAKIDSTYIGANSMIDNLVHIAHNVILGENACIAAQSGISGSAIIGKNLISGGQSGYAGHINIGDNVIVAAKSGVTKNINSNSKIAGFPAIDLRLWKKKIIKGKNDGY
jgi:UDP-3-O-[3-hydroxymyristoyl] glucosamine N-acyltransferase